MGRSRLMADGFNALPPPIEDTEKHKKASVATTQKRYFDECRRIGEEEIREALLREAKKHKAWKAAAVKKMEFEKLEQTSCLQYTLESFTEARSTVESVEAYTLGQMLDHEEKGMGRFDNPWDYEVLPADMFVDQTRVLEMAGTSRLNACSTCDSSGTSHCFHCRGNGTDKCNFCRGTGMKSGVAHPAVYTHPAVATFPHADLSRGYSSSSTAMIGGAGSVYGVGTPMHFMKKTGIPPPGMGTHDLCYMCHGRGVKECHHCKGGGKKPCNACNGSGSVRSFTKLKVYFKVERSDFFSDAEVPERLLSRAEGKDIFSEQREHVLPITSYEVKEVNEQSRLMCAQHWNKCMAQARVIQQRHALIAIPIVKVHFSLGSHKGVFWVYGNQHLCYVPNYPSKCTIL